MSTFFPFNLKLGHPQKARGFNPTEVKDANNNSLLAQWGFGRGTTGRDEIYDKANLGDIRPLQQGRCYRFDGTNDYVDCNDPIIDTFTDLSICFWFKSSVANNRIASIKRSGASDSLVRIGINSGGGLFLEFDDGTVTSVAVGNADDGEWHHVCFTYDADGGSENMKLYYDGVLRNTDTVASFDFSNTDSSLKIGARYDGAANFYTGDLFDFRVCNTALSADEVAYIVTHGDLGIDPGAGQLWYKMDEQAGTTAYDSNGNTNPGTITNATLSTFHATQDIYSYQNQVGYSDGGSGVFVPRDESDPANDVLGNPLDYSGKAPQNPKLINSNCVTLNGTNQGVRVADNTDLDITDNLTVCVWAKNDVASLSATEYVIGKYDSGDNEREWGIAVNSSQQMLAVIGSSDGTSVTTQTTDAAITTDSFNHLAFSFASGTVKVYVNGIPVASTASASHPVTLNNETADLTIGSILSVDTPTNNWDGQIFDARVYAGDSTVLTADEIYSIYSNPSSNITFSGQTLAAHYKLAEGAGTECLDSSGNENHGTIENAGSNWGNTQDNVHWNINTGFSVGVNAVSRSEEFSDANWAKPGGCTVDANASTDPLGGNTADRINTATTNDYVSQTHTVTVNPGDTWVASVWAKADGNVGKTASLRLARGGAGTFEYTAVRITLTDTWTRYEISHTFANAQTGVRFDYGDFASLDTATKSFIWGAQLQVGDTATTYQHTFGDINIGTKIPADQSDPTKDVLGNTLTNPAGNWHNGAETDINFNPSSTPEMANIVTTNAFDGSASYAIIPDNAAFDITDNLTVGCWAKNDNATLSAAQVLFGKWQTTGDQREWVIFVDADEKLVVSVTDVGTNTIYTETADSAVSSLDSWNHFAFTFDGGTLKLYINGAEVSSAGTGTPITTLFNGSGAVTIGVQGGGFYWDGAIEHCRIYSGTSTVLTEAQILQCKEQSEKLLGFADQTLVIAPELKSNTLDYSGNNLHGRNIDVAFTKYTVPTAYSFGDTLTAADNHFKREESNAQEDRFLLYRESLTHNSKLSRVQNYTN